MARGAIAGRGALWTLALLTAVHMLSYFDRMLMVALAPAIKIDLALSDTQLSLLTGGAFVVVYGTTGILGGWLADRVNRARVLAGALTLWSVATMACGLPKSFITMMMARASVGAAESVTIPAALSTIADVFPAGRRPLANAVFYAGSMVGTMLSFVIGAWLSTIVGWRHTFLLAGPPGLIVALIVLLTLRDPKRGAASPVEDELRRSGFAKLRSNTTLIWLILANACSQFASGGMVQWLPMFFMRSHDVSQKSIALLFGPTLGFGMIAGMIAGGMLGNTMARRSIAHMLSLCLWAMLLLVPLFAALLWVPSTGGALTLLFLTVMLSVAFIPCSTAAWQAICPADARGLVSGILGFLSMLIGHGVFPFVIGALSDIWTPTHGAESLRLALTVSLIAGPATAALYVVTIRLTKRDAVHLEQAPA